MRTKIRVTAQRLRELAAAIARGPEAVRQEGTMSVPVQPERDADVVMSAAVDHLETMEADIWYLLDVIKHGMPSLSEPIPSGLDPTMYVTGSETGDRAVAFSIARIRGRMQ
jgi:hypothetical protein